MRRRRLWPALAILAGVVLLGAGWAGWSAYRVNQELSAAVEDATAMRSALEGGDQAAAEAALERLRGHSQGAADRTDGVTWALLERLPFFGDDARGVAVAGSAIADLSRDGLEPLVQAADDLDSLAPRGARIDPAVVQRLQAPVAQAAAAFDEADRRLSAEDPSGYVQRLRGKYRELAGEISSAADALRGADTAVEILPTMLGADRPRNYLLVFQNNAELRATGGLPGAVSLLRAADGRIEMTRQVAGNSFGYTDKPVLPLTAGEREVFGDILGTFFLNANLQPDFPRAADLWKARWEQVHPERLDGVLSIDAVAISYLLGATGPVEVDGVQITADNAVDLLLHEAYSRYPEPKAQDAFFREVARTVFDRASRGSESPRALLRGLSRGAAERRILVHDFDETVQGSLEGTNVAGELATPNAKSPQVGVYFADGSASKMSYFLRYQVDVRSTYCDDGVQGLAGHARLASLAPKDAATTLPDYILGAVDAGESRGDQVVFAYLFAPRGGAVDSVALNGRPLDDFPAVPYGDREVFTAVLNLSPGQEADLTWRMQSGAGQTAPTSLSVTPPVEARTSSARVTSAC